MADTKAFYTPEEDPKVVTPTTLPAFSEFGSRAGTPAESERFVHVESNVYPSTAPVAPAEPAAPAEEDVKTINIHIQINIPSTFRLPSLERFRNFRARRCGLRRQRDGRCRRGRPILALVLITLYLSFISCGGAAWGVRNNHDIWTVPHAPLVIATFSPFLDAFALLLVIVTIKRHQESDKPGFRYVLVALINFLLLILHFVVLGFGIHWITRLRPSYDYWYQARYRRRISGLIIYTMSAMIFMKLALLFAILKNPSLRRKFIDSFKRIPSAIMDEFSYEPLEDDTDADAQEIKSARTSTEGRIYLS
ncbi:hypothetical protein ABW19_dt0206382 [Dactylella cylindrospora]|nr:hypothetical protein ABW19_dt0206382 [Dactylella cylindrospora]